MYTFLNVVNLLFGMNVSIILLIGIIDVAITVWISFMVNGDFR